MPTAIEIPSAVDFGSLSAADQLLAQQRYQHALTSGYDEDTAAALYLAPMQAKWKIIQSNPTEFQDPDKLAKINQDFEDATASAVRNNTRGTSAVEALTTRIAPLLQSWSAVGKKPTLDPIQQQQLRDTQSEINRLSREKSFYGRQAIMQTADPLKRQAAADALERANGLLQAAKEERDAILRGPTVEPTMQSAADALTVQPTNPVGYTDEEMSRVLTTPIQAPQAEVAPVLPAAKKPLIFIAGRPDLSTVSREEADRSWAAQFPVTKSDVSAADALTRQAAIDVAKSQLPDFTGIPAPITAKSALPKIGQVRKGYRFKGGDPSKKENWEKV